MVEGYSGYSGDVCSKLLVHTRYSIGMQGFIQDFWLGGGNLLVYK